MLERRAGQGISEIRPAADTQLLVRREARLPDTGRPGHQGPLRGHRNSVSGTRAPERAGNLRRT